MARLKFLLFALVVLGLWTTQLYVLPSALSARTVEDATVRARLAPALTAAKLDARRMELQQVALKVAGSPALMAPFVPSAPSRSGKSPEPPPAEAPDADLLKQVRSVVSPAIPEPIRRDFLLGVVNEAGSLYVRGDADPQAVQGLDAAAKAGGAGQVLDAFGQPYVLYSLPVSVLDRPGADPRQVATVVLGAPLVSTELMPEVVKAAGLSAMALMVKDGKPRVYGQDNARIEAAAQALKPGQTLVVSQGAVSHLGPLQLPLLTSPDDLMGGHAPLLLATRETLVGTPYDVLALVTLQPTLAVLASFQRLTLFGFAGLLGLSLVWTILMGLGQTASAGEAREKKPKRDTLGLTPTGFPPASPGVPAEPIEAAPPMDPITELPAPPPVGDSHQPWEAPPPVPVQAAVGMQDYGVQPAGGLPPPVPDFFSDSGAAQPPAAAPRPFPQAASPALDNVTTRAYPIPSQAELDSYPLPPTQAPQRHAPETTLVSAIPDELLRAAARPAEPMEPPITSTGSFAAASVPLPGTGAPQENSEEQHFQQIYQEFVATREKCGEPADGLTLDKFMQKLRKNKEQLVQKYNCKSVRFVVYVKDGKAALKATPVKD